MRYFLSLGTNLGDKRKNLGRAREALEKAGVKVAEASAVYATEPVGVSAQPWFCNQVIRVETARSPLDLLAIAKKIERDLGRRPCKRNAPRTIDIDILLAGRRITSTPNLVIPHPRMAGRNFVLIPLNEIAPRAVHPVLGVRVQTLVKRSLDRSVVRRTGPAACGNRRGKK